MNNGDAASWKEQLLKDAMAKPVFDLGTWNEFQKNLKTAFEPYDAPGDALEEMKSLWMGNRSIEEHNAQFKMIVTQTGLESLDKESPAVTDYYWETLNIPLQRQILSLENPPKTLDDWYTWEKNFDNNWRRMQKVLGQSRDSNDKKDTLTHWMKFEGRGECKADAYNTIYRSRVNNWQSVVYIAFWRNGSARDLWPAFTVPRCFTRFMFIPLTDLESGTRHKEPLKIDLNLTYIQNEQTW